MQYLCVNSAEGDARLPFNIDGVVGSDFTNPALENIRECGLIETCPGIYRSYNKNIVNK